MTRYYNEDLKYPDMTLYQEIIWLQTFFKRNWVIENVKPYYKPLIQPSFTIDRHLYWSNKFIMTIQYDDKYFETESNILAMEKKYSFDLSKYKIKNKRLLLRNCVTPEIGKYIFENIIS